VELPSVKLDSRLLATRLRPLIKGEVLDDRVTRLLYSTDGSIYKLVPAVVVCPRDAEDVLRLVVFSQETGIPLSPRGAGTGLAGESLTTGILLDFARYMTDIIEFDFDQGWVRVQPGAILDEINRLARPRGWQFGPDPSSGSRATVGGSVANNATGAHSLHYGYCSDNLVSLQTVLSDGRLISTDDAAGQELQKKIYDLLNPNRKIIDQFWPALKRNRAGYNLKGVLSRSGGDLVKLFAGSEGTLGVFTEITLQLVRAPAVKVALSANFDDLALSARAVNIILEFNPAAVELMDGTLIKLARSADKQLAEVLPESQASLLIEFNDRGVLEDCKKKLAGEFGRHVTLHEMLDPAEQKRHWSARKSAVPLLFRQPGPARPAAFVEDIAVDSSKLPEYLQGMQGVFEKYGLHASFYGHAGSGEFHIRPFLNLRDPLEREKLSDLARDAYELVWSLGGTISGEHAAGIIRSWALRKQYGPAYECMEQVKRLLDPAGILNPGKIIVTDTDLPLDNLRADETLQGERIGPKLFYRDQKIAELADICNGCGECKALDPAQMMCPVFRAHRDEYSSPRAKANLFREYLAGLLTEEDLLSPMAQRVIDHCLLCGNCLRECPSAVHIPQLIIELRTLRRKLIGDKSIEKFFVEAEYAEWFSSKFAPITNFLFSRPGFRRILEKFMGIDSRRAMPAFAFPGLMGTLRKLAKKYRPAEVRYRAAWFVDLYARYHDTKLAEDIVKVCAANHIELVIPDQCGCNMPALAYGFLDHARKAAQFNIDQFSSLLGEVDMVLSFEPTAALCLQREYKYLIDDPRLDAMADKVRDGSDFLWQLHLEGKLKRGGHLASMTVAYHTPCHLRMLQIGEPGYKLLGLIDGLKVEHLINNCCGLAGTFGMNREKYDTSATIAQNLKENILKGGFKYDALVSDCSSCRMQLNHLSNLPTFHPVQLLARWYLK
jgi:FAD/FMN-containing dehydrogenase/Fe-S oxidoreductase